MFTLAGILADEEPKTAISPNGLYNTSVVSSDAVFSSALLEGLSDFTIMNWFYLDPVDVNNFYTQSYFEFGSGVTLNPIRVFEDKIEVSISNSNGGTTFLSHTYSTPVNQWLHIAVTGSTTSGFVKLYINGAEVASAVMTYSNASGVTNQYIPDSSTTSIAQLNIYNRELTDIEVAEHYVVIDAQVGVLAYDAMTTAQRNGLIYCTSLINDISFDGNEFKDRSTSNISISPQPSLTGQQIYVYTDASDLPSGVNDFALNVAELNGTNQYFIIPQGATDFTASGAMTWIGWYNPNSSPNTYAPLINRRSGANASTIDFQITHVISEGGGQDLKIRFDQNGSQSHSSSTVPNNNDWVHLAVTYDEVNVKFYINGQLDNTIADTNPLTNNATISHIGFDSNTTVGQYGKFLCSFFELHDSVLSLSDIQSAYNNGTPLCYGDRTITPTAFWNLSTFNGRAESTAIVDQVGSSDLTAIGSPTYTDTGALIVSEGGVQYNTNFSDYNGTNYIEADSSLSVGTQQSLSVWIKTNVLQADLNAFDMNFGTGIDANAGPRLEVDASGNTVLYWNETGGVNNATFGTISTGNWYHILYTCDAGEFKTYLNGALVTTTTSTVGYNQTYAKMAFGVGFNTGRLWDDGSIAFPMVFNKIVSTDEINELYNSGTPKSFASLSSTLSDDCIYAPRLSNWNGNAGSETTDQSTSGITATWTGTPTYESELAVECDEAPV